MNIALLHTKDNVVNLKCQQKHIFCYAHVNNLTIDSFNISDSISCKNELKKLLDSLVRDDCILIYSLSTFSHDMKELIGIFNCLFERSINVHVASLDLNITKDIQANLIFNIFLQEQEKNLLQSRPLAQGRPKGRVSKSKFDIHRLKIIKLLEDRCSVNEISKILGECRSSLKDYINSRGLKELIKTKESLLAQTDKCQIKKILKT